MSPVKRVAILLPLHTLRRRRRRRLAGAERGSHFSQIGLGQLRRFEEARSLFRKTTPVARRVLGDSDALTMRMKLGYVMSLYRDPGATLDDLREAVTTLEDSQRIARRVFGGAHPLTMGIEGGLQEARAVHGKRELMARLAT